MAIKLLSEFKGIDNCTVKVAGCHSVTWGEGRLQKEKRKNHYMFITLFHIVTKYLLVQHICNTIPQKGLIRYNCSKKVKNSYLGYNATLQSLHTSSMVPRRTLIVR